MGHDSTPDSPPRQAADGDEFKPHDSRVTPLRLDRGLNLRIVEHIALSMSASYNNNCGSRVA